MGAVPGRVGDDEGGRGLADARGAWAYDGATSGTAWLAHRCGLSRSSAGTLVRTARRLQTMPATETALADGTLSLAKATLLASAACRSDRTREVFARHEEVLVEHARRLTVDQTAQMLQHWLLLADPDLGRARARRRSAARVEHVRRSHGTQRLVDQR